MKLNLLAATIISLLAAQIAAAQEASDAQPSKPKDDQPVEQVVVTGSNIRGVQKEGASAVQVITAKQIKASGKTNLPDILRSISANSGNSFNEQYTGSFSAGTAGVSLRGLGQKNTLILLDGKRLANYATAQDLQDTFVDINSLPLAAVERIEVLKDGASAVYGSDAVAGVVNIILKKNFQGVELGGSLGHSGGGTGQDERNYQFLAGKGDLNKDGYNIFFSLDGQIREELDATDVGYLRDSDFRSKAGGRLNWTPTNYYNNDPTQGFSKAVGPVQRVPWGEISPGKKGDVWAYNPAQYDTLMPSINRYHALLRGTLQINDQLQAYSELLYSHSTASFIFGGPLSIGSSLQAWDNANQRLTKIDTTLPVGNPANPNAVPTPVSTNLWSLGIRNKTDSTEFSREVIGLKGSFNTWDWDLSALHSESRLQETVTNFGNRYAFQQLLANGGYDFTTINNPASAVNALSLSTLRPAVSKLNVIDATIAGPLWTLPAGDIGFAAGYQFRNESLNSQTSTAVLSGTELRPAIDIIDGSRNVSALFAEFKVPVLSTLEANVAGRLDHYSDFGTAFSPKFSLRYQPTNWLLLRGTASRGFRAPSLPEITNSSAISYTSVKDPYDPITPNQVRSITGVYAANPKLDPERSKNYNLGIVLSPAVNTSIALDYYRISQTGIIGPDDLNYIVQNPALYPGRVVRDPQGRILTISNQYQNQSARTTSGLDLDVRQVFPAGDLGKFTLRGGWSYLLNFKQPQVAGQSSVDGSGSNTFGALPKWRGTTELTWDYRDISSTLGWYYTGSYKIDDNLREDDYPTRVAGNSTFDLSVSYTGIKNTTLKLAAQNILNQKPSWDPSTPYYDISLYDPRGRFITLGASYKF
ncbi:TonB-dependent receptor [Aquirhabdus parva]|uniref:TonB-dependent receptor n=1 Tax=Aquirhabdus parva TaxID=2283318 RepID=A0A345PA54_9GAMM|nr:TonB-dependent receptor [Aquirhabdus parva]AXI04163.1 TonB-dependent receptor [Aquirhabdus parva]